MIESEERVGELVVAENGNVVRLPHRTREERKQAVVEFVRENPGLAVAGGLVVGLVVGRLLPRRRAKADVHTPSQLFETIGAATLMLGRQAAQHARATGGDLLHRGEAIAGRAETLGASAARKVGAVAHDAADQTAKLGKTGASRASEAGGVASDWSSHMLSVAEDAAHSAEKQVKQLVSSIKTKLKP